MNKSEKQLISDLSEAWNLFGAADRKKAEDGKDFEHLCATVAAAALGGECPEGILGYLENLQSMRRVVDLDEILTDLGLRWGVVLEGQNCLDPEKIERVLANRRKVKDWGGEWIEVRGFLGVTVYPKDYKNQSHVFAIVPRHLLPRSYRKVNKNLQGHFVIDTAESGNDRMMLADSRDIADRLKVEVNEGAETWLGIVVKE